MYHFGYYEWGNCEEIDGQFLISLRIIIALLIVPMSHRLLMAESFFLLINYNQKFIVNVSRCHP
jgi:hypothetical protein